MGLLIIKGSQSRIAASDQELVPLQCRLSVRLIFLARCGAVGVLRFLAADAVEGVEVLLVGVGERM